MQTMTFDIHGMTCGGCVGGVQRTLQKIDGVGDIQVSLRPGRATWLAESKNPKHHSCATNSKDRKGQH